MPRLAVCGILAFLAVLHAREGTGQTPRTIEEQRAYLNSLWNRFTPSEREALGVEVRSRQKAIDEQTARVAKETEQLNQKLRRSSGVYAESTTRDFNLLRLFGQKTNELGELRTSQATIQKTLMSLNHLTNASIKERDSITDRRVLQLQIESISAIAHPSYLMCADDILDKSRLQYWEKDVSAFAKQHVAVGDSVGRVQCSRRLDASTATCTEASGSSGGWRYSNAGTAFVVKADAMVTNRHVVLNFARESEGRRWVFRSGFSARVEFPGLYDGCAMTRPALSRTVTEIFVHPTEDIAILKFKEAGLPVVLSLQPEQDPRGPVAVIGYPVRDFRVPRETQEMVFKGPKGDVPFGVRRIQPGDVTFKERANVWRTDASALNGNSGSPVVRIGDGAVVGIHVGGYPGGENVFIGAAEINALLKSVP